jgi:hypothetical protein
MRSSGDVSIGRLRVADDAASASTQADNAALGGEVFVGTTLAGVLTPPNSTPVNNSPYLSAFFGNQETDVDADAGAVLYILFQFTKDDLSLQCDMVIAGYLTNK